MNENIVLKGDRDGLLLVINSAQPFEEIIDFLRNKLDTSSEFFISSPEPLHIRYKGMRVLSAGDNTDLTRLFSEYGLIYDKSSAEKIVEQIEAASKPLPVMSIKEEEDKDKDDDDKMTFPGLPPNSPPGSAELPVMVIPRTVRGGQSIRYDGSIIIMGDVNPSAYIMAKNDIFVAGATRGILHAGCYGDQSATVIAASFNGGQIRIANLVARSPEEGVPAGGFEKARVQGGNIFIDNVRIQGGL